MGNCGLESINENRLVSIVEMRRREDYGAQIGVTKLMMMANAGSSIARFIRDRFEDNASVLVIAGCGNNGGDCFVAARHLSYWKSFDIILMLVGNEEDIRAEEAKTNWAISKKVSGIKLIMIQSVDDIVLHQERIRQSHVIVAGLFGTGFKGKPRQLQARIIEAINGSAAMKISVDIPSGMEADSGEFERVVLSDFTVTMDSAKRGLVATEKSKKACGTILVANIGLPE